MLTGTNLKWTYVSESRNSYRRGTHDCQSLVGGCLQAQCCNLIRNDCCPLLRGRHYCCNSQHTGCRWTLSRRHPRPGKAPLGEPKPEWSQHRIVAKPSVCDTRLGFSWSHSHICHWSTFGEVRKMKGVWKYCRWSGCAKKCVYNSNRSSLAPGSTVQQQFARP